MKKSILFLSSLLIIALFQITLTSNSGGKADFSAIGCGGNTGDACHQSADASTSISMTIGGIAPVSMGSYVPGQVYQIVINLGRGTLPNKPAGFDLSFSKGVLTTLDPTITAVDSQLHHNAPKNTNITGDVLWGTGDTILWTAPAVGSGSVAIFLSGNVTNGNGGADAGDEWNSMSPSAVVLTEGGATGKPSIIGLKAVSISNTSATLRDTLSANGSTTTDTFEYGLTTSYGTILKPTPATIIGTTTSFRSVNLTGLTPNTLYHWRVRASNASGQTISADSTFKTTTLPAAKVPIISGVGHSNLTNTSAKISATVNANGTPTSSIRVFYGTSTLYTDSIVTNPTLAVGTGNTAVTATLSGLAKGTLYHYQVKAVNSVGEATSNDITFTTTNIAGIASLVSKEFGMYPNPSTDFLYISSDVKNILEVTAVTLSGKTISLDAQKLASDHIKVSTKNLSSGVYYIRVKTTEGWIQNSKSIKIE